MIKKKIALVVDTENWAFDIEAKLLKNRLKEYYDIDVFCSASEKYSDDLFLILEDTKEYNMIHFFWRKLLVQFLDDVFKEKVEKTNTTYDEYVGSVNNKISTGIYDHLFIEPENVGIYKQVFNNCCKSYYTCSKRLENIYSNIKDYPKPWGTIHDTYDDKLYDGGDRNRFSSKDINSPLVIGWVGNSKWNIKYQDFKGFHSLLEPVIDELISEGYNIKKHYADKNVKFRSNEEMPAYYQEIDVCIILSTLEGTPRPVIEGMASGVPIITTDVGIVPEVLGPKQQEFILGNRDNGNNDEEIKKKLKEKLIYLYENRSFLEELSKENYEYAPNNDISHLYVEYKNYFDDFLE